MFLLLWHSKYSALLSKIHSHRLLFRRFCRLGSHWQLKILLI